MHHWILTLVAIYIDDANIIINVLNFIFKCPYYLFLEGVLFFSVTRQNGLKPKTYLRSSFHF